MTKKYLIDYPNLLREWDYDKNGELNISPESLTSGSHRKVWWKCEKGHSWSAMVSNRMGHNRGCPYCSHQLPVKGETDLASCFPELVKEWHPTKNKMSPDEVMPGTHKKAWWVCPVGHEWQAEIKSRTTGVGCPYCAGKKVLKGFNDLASLDPELASEWHPTKNGDLRPDAVTISSGKKVWWLCKNKHEYAATVYDRKAGRGCPQCTKSMRTSFPEQAVYYYIKQFFPDAINSYKGIFQSSMELDIFIPSIKVGIEYDGKVYHSDSSMQLRDAKKYGICKENGIILIRIIESKHHIPLLTCDHKIEIPNASDKHLNWAINNLCYHLGKYVMPDVKRDRKEILSLLEKRKVSIASEYPEIAKEWDYEKNYPLVPENFAPCSNEKVWWRCSKCGHVWETTMATRTRGCGCPMCGSLNAAKKRIEEIIEEKGSFADNYPELLDEWDPNNKVSPYEITPSSQQKVSWICKKCGASWKSDTAHRIAGRGCPYCAGKKVKTGLNDLATLHPELMVEWDYGKNVELDPTQLARRSGKKAWWKCSNCGYEWQTAICVRTNGNGCPKCGSKQKGQSFSKNRAMERGSLKELLPEIASEWNYEKNIGVLPDDVTIGSGKKVWWKCSNCGHEWAAIIATRSKGSRCPNCKRSVLTDTDISKPSPK